MSPALDRGTRGGGPVTILEQFREQVPTSWR